MGAVPVQHARGVRGQAALLLRQQAGRVAQAGGAGPGRRLVDGDRVLLGRQPTWPPQRYSALAGFVEPGESLEEAVAREVREEAGVEIANPRYVSSQPWPFPSSLMLGFIADWAAGDPQPRDEVEDARWFDRAEVAEAAAGRGELKLPPRLAIAHRLIEGWLSSR